MPRIIDPVFLWAILSNLTAFEVITMVLIGIVALFLVSFLLPEDAKKPHREDS